MRLVIDTFNLHDVERMLCVEALNLAGSIVEAAALLGITRHALKRRIIKHTIAWPPPRHAVVAGDPQGPRDAAAPAAPPFARFD